MFVLYPLGTCGEPRWRFTKTQLVPRRSVRVALHVLLGDGFSSSELFPEHLPLFLDLDGWQYDHIVKHLIASRLDRLLKKDILDQAIRSLEKTSFTDWRGARLMLLCFYSKPTSSNSVMSGPRTCNVRITCGRSFAARRTQRCAPT